MTRVKEEAGSGRSCHVSAPHSKEALQAGAGSWSPEPPVQVTTKQR